MLQLDFICRGADHQDTEKTKPEENTEQREMWCFPLWTRGADSEGGQTDAGLGWRPGGGVCSGPRAWVVQPAASLGERGLLESAAWGCVLCRAAGRPHWPDPEGLLCPSAGLAP